MLGRGERRDVVVGEVDRRCAGSGHAGTTTGALCEWIGDVHAQHLGSGRGRPSGELTGLVVVKSLESVCLPCEWWRCSTGAKPTSYWWTRCTLVLTPSTWAKAVWRGLLVVVVSGEQVSGASQVFKWVNGRYSLRLPTTRPPLIHYIQ